MQAEIDDKDELEKFTPKLYKEGNVKKKKIFLMCKFFAHGHRCLYKLRGRKCNLAHSKPVRNAFNKIMESRKNKTKLTQKMIDEILNPEKKLDELDVEVLIALLNKYPQPPSKEEIEEV